MADREASDLAITPVGVGHEMKQPLMLGIRSHGVAACARGDGLDALSLALGEQPHCVCREGGAPGVVPKQRTHLVEVLLESILRIGVQVAHELTEDHATRSCANFQIVGSVSDRSSSTSRSTANRDAAVLMNVASCAR